MSKPSTSKPSSSKRRSSTSSANKRARSPASKPKTQAPPPQDAAPQSAGPTLEIAQVEAKRRTGRPGSREGQTLQTAGRADAAIVAPLAPAAVVAIHIYDFGGARVFPVAVADPANPRTVRAHAMISSVLAFYRDMFGRSSYDDAGGRVVLFLGDASVDGAMRDDRMECLRFSDFWRGVRESQGVRVFFEFSDFAFAPDYVAHEFQHAVTAKCADLDYDKPQQAALHESLSDVFAFTFCDWLRRKQGNPGAPDWRFGAGTARITSPPGMNACTRNFEQPHDPQAWDGGFADIADLMANVGQQMSPYQLSYIPTRAFRATTLALGDIRDAARIWYAALASGAAMRNVHTLQAFADLTAGAAQELDALRRGAPVPSLLDAVIGGWREVGVFAQPAPTAAPDVIGRINDLWTV